MTEKMTIAKAMDYVITHYGDDLPADVLEKVEGVKVQAEKKNSTPKKPTARQNENELIKEAILATLDPSAVYYAADIKAAVPALADVSPQRIGGILRQMVLAGTMLSDVEKGKKRYQVA